MQSLKFTNAKIIIDNGDWLCLKVDNKYQAREFIDNKKDKLYVAELKEYRQKRSLDANAYYWTLLNELANVLRTDKDELHFIILKRYGQRKEISIISKAVEDLKSYIKYFEIRGTSTLKNEEWTHLFLYKGSSEMDSREMAILIDGIVSECKNVGIPTETPGELARMCNEWKT